MIINKNLKFIEILEGIYYEFKYFSIIDFEKEQQDIIITQNIEEPSAYLEPIKKYFGKFYIQLTILCSYNDDEWRTIGEPSSEYNRKVAFSFKNKWGSLCNISLDDYIWFDSKDEAARFMKKIIKQLNTNYVVDRNYIEKLYKNRRSF